MEFPITRERLQGYMNGEAQLNALKNGTANTIKQFCQDLERHVMMGEKKFVYNFDVRHKSLHPSSGRFGIAPNVIKKYIIQEIEKMLPDCTLTIDPLETYMIIDWS